MTFQQMMYTFKPHEVWYQKWCKIKFYNIVSWVECLL